MIVFLAIIAAAPTGCQSLGSRGYTDAPPMSGLAVILQIQTGHFESGIEHEAAIAALMRDEPTPREFTEQSSGHVVRGGKAPEKAQCGASRTSVTMLFVQARGFPAISSPLWQQLRDQFV